MLLDLIETDRHVEGLAGITQALLDQVAKVSQVPVGTVGDIGVGHRTLDQGRHDDHDHQPDKLDRLHDRLLARGPFATLQILHTANCSGTQANMRR